MSWPRIESVLKNCIMCNKEFITKIRWGNKKFCSINCYHLHQSKYNYQYKQGIKKGHHFSENTKKKMSLAKIGKYIGRHNSPKTEFKYGQEHFNWKGGISKILSKTHHYKSRSGLNAKEYKKLARKKYKYSRKNAGKLTIKTIQLVYEDNIKRYGTLACYLCLNPIELGKDSLEHKTPLSRGGTNEYNNLEIAHLSCNCKKHNKTEQEYRGD